MTLFKYFLFLLAILNSIRPALPQYEITPNIRITDDVNSLDWQKGNTIYDKILFCNIMEGLTEVDFSLQIRPALAEKWTISDNGLIYTFYLRKNIKWSNGANVNANNFIQAWHRLLDPIEKNYFSYLLYNVVNAEDYAKGKIRDFSKVGFKEINSNTIEITLKKTTNYLPYLMATHMLFPIESGFLKQIKKNNELWSNPISVPTTGPYLIDNWKKKKRIDFKYNEKYYGITPSVKKATYKVIPDILLATEAFLSNEIQILAGIDDNALLRIKTSEKLTRQEIYRYLDTIYVGFNFRSPIFSHLENRKEIFKALNKKIITKNLSSRYEIANSLIPMGISGAWNYEENTINDPIIKNSTLTNKTIKILSSNYASHRALADIVKDRLYDVFKINVLIDIVPAVDLEKTILTHSHDLFIGVLDVDIPHASVLLTPFLSNSSRNILAVENNALDTILGSFEEKSEEENLEPLRIAQKILLKDLVALIPIYHTNTRALWSKEIDHFELTPLKQLFIKKIKMK